MNHSKIIQFIADNQDRDLKDFYDKSYSKLQDLNQRIDRTTVSLIVIALVYFLLSKSSVESFSIGPFNIKDITVISKLLPILFAYLLFDFVISSIHKSEVLVTVKLLFLSLYTQETDIYAYVDMKNNHNFFTRVLLPFSFKNDISRLYADKMSARSILFMLLLIMPLMSLYLIPFILEFYMLKDLYVHQYNEWAGKLSFYLTIYINLALIFYYVRASVAKYNDIKQNHLSDEKQMYGELLKSLRRH